MFRLIKDFLVPEVEPEAGFIFSFKPGEPPRDNNSQTVDGAPDASLGRLSVRAQWGGRRTILPQRAESQATVSLHSRQVPQR